MLPYRLSCSIAGQWLRVLSCVALVIGPFGCETMMLVDGATAKAGRIGFAVNADTTSQVLMSVGDSAGATAFVFGTRGPGGEPEEITAAVVRAEDGSEAFITFDAGRPVHVQGADGSYVHIRYSELSSDRLSAAVDVYSAPDDTKQTFNVQIDLDRALAELAAIFDETTGEHLAVVPAPAPQTGGKTATANQRHVWMPVSVVIVPFTTLVSFTSVILAQVFVLIFDVAVAAMYSILAAIMWPFIVLAELTRSALILPAGVVDLLAFHGYVPTVPVVILR